MTVTEANSRISIRRQKKDGVIVKNKREIAEKVRQGMAARTVLISVDNIIYDEGLLQVYDILLNYLKHLKSKQKDFENKRLPDDIKN
mmetsp:Transcript_17525/g.17274  ORF Transcript_17525/g.17274 Transcript_17525/m.17274 type:complete len:87 (+) Transcript_17525:31-291(+)